MLRRFFALFMVSALLFAGTLPALAAGGPPATSGNSDDEYIVGLLGPIEVLRPFKVGVTSMAILPNWGGYYFSGQTIARGSVVVTNQAPVPYGLALWADPSPHKSWPLIRNIRAAQHGPGGLAPWLELNDNLVLGSGETWTIEYNMVVAPDSWGGRVERISVRINHLSVCETATGKLEICGVG